MVGGGKISANFIEKQLAVLFVTVLLSYRRMDGEERDQNLNHESREMNGKIFTREAQR